MNTRVALIVLIFFCKILTVKGQNDCGDNPYFIGSGGGGVGDANVWDLIWMWPGMSVHCDDDADGWILVCEDQFDGNALNEDIWSNNPWPKTICPSPDNKPCWPPLADAPNGYSFDKRWANINRPEDVEVSGGWLRIKHHILTQPVNLCGDWGGSYPNFTYSSCWDYPFSIGFIESKQEFPAGRYEASIRIPQNDKTWPAFWSRHYGTHGWQEVDGFEFGLSVSDNCYDRAYSNLIHYTLWGTAGCVENAGGDFSTHYDQTRAIYCPNINFTGWHKYSYEWSPWKVVFGLDNSEMQVINKLMDLSGSFYVSNCAGPPILEPVRICRIMPDKFANMSVILNSAIDRATYNNCGVDASIDGDEMQVDWFRYYLPIKCDEEKPVLSYKYSGDCYYNEKATPSCFAAGVLDVADASHSITAFPGDYLTLIAAEEINLNPGFEAQIGSHIDAEIRPCSNPHFFEAMKPVTPSSSSGGDKPKQLANDLGGDILGMTIYPNPNNGKFTVLYNLPTSGDIEFFVTDLSGKRLRTLAHNTAIYAGNFSLKVEDANLEPGSYYVSMKTASQTISKGIVVVN